MTDADRIRVVLIDDHTVVRRGLRSFLEAHPDIQIVGEAESGERALERIDSWLPDVAVMDLLMPGGINGIETTARLRRVSPHTKVVVLTAYTDDERVVAALRAGATGYVRKDAVPELLLTAIRAAARGQSTLDPAIATAILQEVLRGKQVMPDALTEREQEVLRQLGTGRTNREIGEMLVIGEETVKTHVANILSKLQQADRMQAVIYALKQGLISLDDL